MYGSASGRFRDRLRSLGARRQNLPIKRENHVEYLYKSQC